MNYNITGLSPGTEYTLRVAASTVNGTGPYSSWRRIKTVETGKKIHGIIILIKEIFSLFCMD